MNKPSSNQLARAIELSNMVVAAQQQGCIAPVSCELGSEDWQIILCGLRSWVILWRATDLASSGFTEEEIVLIGKLLPFTSVE